MTKARFNAIFLLRRDRYETEGIILDTYATREGLTEEYLEVQYPPQDRITTGNGFLDYGTDQSDRAASLF